MLVRLWLWLALGSQSGDFGSRFIEGSVASELQGKARLDYDPAGVVCTMEIPLEEVQAPR